MSVVESIAAKNMSVARSDGLSSVMLVVGLIEISATVGRIVLANTSRGSSCSTRKPTRK